MTITRKHCLNCYRINISNSEYCSYHRKKFKGSIGVL